MALVHLSSLTLGFNKMLPFERNSSLIETRKRNIPSQIQCLPLNKASNNDNTTIFRRTANFQPSIWHYEYIQSLNTDYKEESYKEKIKVLREEVRMVLCKVEKMLDQLELIDVLQRLGIAYHFNNEIWNILNNIYYMDNSEKKSLHVTALEFRLLRQHGYNISTDVFLSFLDDMHNFKEYQSVDVQGMLALYEASFYSMEGEKILDEARDLTTKFLAEYLNQNECSYLSLLTEHALELPLHWRIPRWEARWFINTYKRRQNMNPTLLQLAKLDFNRLQSIYQEELKFTSRWWKSTGLAEKLSFARDRLAENYIWTVGTNFEPDLGYSRKVITKINCFITVIDDIYDVHGTLEELELFTKAIDRWDSRTINDLPDYMKTCFLELHNFVTELALETLKKNGGYIAPYLKKVWTDLCKSYLVEAKWYHGKYKPSLEEYMENARISISAPVILTHVYFLIPHLFVEEEQVPLEEYSETVRLSATILRLANDLGTYKRENATGDVPKWIQCYMNETGASEVKAREHIKSLLCITWKKMNREAHNSSLTQRFVETAINLARMSLCMYQHGDGHTIQDPKTQSRIRSLIIQPIQ
ncbi:hypothetical protein HN51_044960 [Arachis hypogaea]|nr:terpene synthase 10 [Arachis ipaensis]XP_025671772.1 terpene synthase 10-like [Arachis hypogaea]